MAIEVEIFDLEGPAKQVVFDIHGTRRIITDNTFGRTLHGWYERKGIRVKFYYKPSWLARQRMRWFHGWKWIDVDDKSKTV